MRAHPWILVGTSGFILGYAPSAYCRGILADRLERGPMDAIDLSLAAMIVEGAKIVRAGWFN